MEKKETVEIDYDSPKYKELIKMICVPSSVDHSLKLSLENITEVKKTCPKSIKVGITLGKKDLGNYWQRGQHHRPHHIYKKG